jgi:hypothetical protein
MVDPAEARARMRRVETGQAARQAEAWVTETATAERERIVRLIETMEKPDPEALEDYRKELAVWRKLARRNANDIAAGRRAMEDSE